MPCTAIPAIEACKHVYTEWLLGRTTAEAEELAALARAKDVQTAVGLHRFLDTIRQSAETGRELPVV